ncbi:MAG: fatty acid desaturase family protein [Myxococcales bacterium]
MSNLRAELKAELDAAGLLEERPGLTYLKAAVLLAATISLFLLCYHAPSWWMKLPLFAAGIFTNVALIMMGHESGHGSVSQNRWLNDALGYFAFPLMSGLSLTYWKYKHNTLHHSYPNVAHKDPDIAVYPFAFYKEQKTEKAGPARFVQKYQGLLFWPLTLLTGFAMRFDSLVFLGGRGRKLVKADARLADIACLVTHYALWLVVPTLVFGLPVVPVAVAFVVWNALAGILLGAIFVPAHMTMPLYREYDENFILQLRTTQNLKTNRLFSFLLIGLDHQVEHHLFQRMPHHGVRKASPIVRAFCERHGLPYNEQPWGRALWETTRRLDTLPEYELIERPPAADRLAGLRLDEEAAPA